MSSIQTIQKLNKQMKQLLDNKDYSNPKLKEITKSLKLTIYGNDALEAESDQYLKQATAFAEMNLFLTLATKNTKDMQLAIDNIKFFQGNNLWRTKPDNYYMVTGIHLLYLLSSHHNEEFYSKLETLTTEDLSNKYIAYVFSMNDAIEEGNYRKVFKLKKESPLEYFQPFLERISQTVRIEIAKSSEKAYSQLPIEEAKQIFQVEDEVALKSFVKRYIESQEEIQTNWNFEGKNIRFVKANMHKIKFNSEDLIQKTLFYAEELQKIT